MRERKNMTTPENTTVIDLRSEQADVCAGNWMQERYYSDGGARVRDLLSFASVFGVHPFEVGVDRRAERAAYRAKRGVCANLLDLGPLMRRPVLGLSNGEMRRVLFARAVLRSAGALALVSPTAGLDPRQRSRFARAIDALRDAGLDIRVVADGDDTDPREAVAGRPPRPTGGKAVVEIGGLTLRLGSRTLFRNLSWTGREGERRVLCGPNGSGKTTLLALLTGDSPLAYAHDIRLFGVPRANGHDLARTRRRIASVSPEMQAYLGVPADALLERALARRPDLLLLDEPCCNADGRTARRLLSRVDDWLKRHPRAAAVCVAHRASHVPKGFDRLLDLSRYAPPDRERERADQIGSAVDSGPDA
jgi:ABC-type molybdenum transport system ATPase subunit/photorepair protein PhrA